MKLVEETENADASAPDRMISDTLNVVFPVLDMVSDSEPDAPTVTSPNAKEDETEIDDAVPVPLNGTLAGLPVALWVMDSVALLAPAKAGEIVTTTS